jgi:hypothetical protein
MPSLSRLVAAQDVSAETRRPLFGCQIRYPSAGQSETPLGALAGCDARTACGVGVIDRRVDACRRGPATWCSPDFGRFFGWAVTGPARVR